MGEWDNYCDEIGGVCKDMEAQAARIAELEKEKSELLAKCEKYEYEIGLAKQRIAALESKSNMYADLAVATASAACKVDVLEKERDRLREALKEVLNCEVVTDTGDYSKGGTGFDCNEVKEIIRGALTE